MLQVFAVCHCSADVAALLGQQSVLQTYRENMLSKQPHQSTTLAGQAAITIHNLD